jgi:hypothetical protein
MISFSSRLNRVVVCGESGMMKDMAIPHKKHPALKMSALGMHRYLPNQQEDHPPRGNADLQLTDPEAEDPTEANSDALRSVPTTNNEWLLLAREPHGSDGH